MNKRDKEILMVAALADKYRKFSDDRLLWLSHATGFHWDIKYRKAFNIVLKERGLKLIE